VPESGSAFELDSGSESDSNLKSIKEEFLRKGNFSAAELEKFHKRCDEGMHPRLACKEAKLNTWVEVNNECRAKELDNVSRNATRRKKWRRLLSKAGSDSKAESRSAPPRRKPRKKVR
jgi:hypothetical protein